MNTWDAEEAHYRRWLPRPSVFIADCGVIGMLHCRLVASRFSVRGCFLVDWAKLVCVIPSMVFMSAPKLGLQLECHWNSVGRALSGDQVVRTLADAWMNAVLS